MIHVGKVGGLKCNQVAEYLKLRVVQIGWIPVLYACSELTWAVCLCSKPTCRPWYLYSGVRPILYFLPQTLIRLSDVFYSSRSIFLLDFSPAARISPQRVGATGIPHLDIMP